MKTGYEIMDDTEVACTNEQDRRKGHNDFMSSPKESKCIDFTPSRRNAGITF